MLFFSPDCSENTCMPGFGIQDCNEKREKCCYKMPNVLLLKTIINTYLLIELKAEIDRKCFLFINYLYPSKIDNHNNSTF